ncbi:MAG: hypothetical protein PVG66_08130 [Chromatiales bacterium]|jgi:hypothetical protein
MIKNKNNSLWILTGVFFSSVVLMTLYEFIKELIFKGTLTPWESHSITILVTSLIATVAAAVMRSWALSIYARQKELEVEQRSLVSYRLVLSAVNHIVNNVLNYLQIVRLEIDRDGRVKDETMNLLTQSIKEASKQIRILNEIEKPGDPESYKNIYPPGVYPKG